MAKIDDLGVLINVNHQDLCTETGAYTLPETVKLISSFAFQQVRSKVTRITFSKGLQLTGNWSLKDCENLTHVTLNDEIISIQQGTFKSCVLLAGCNMPRALKSISSEAFYGCKNLPRVDLNDAIERIGSYAFFGCTSFESFSLPPSVRHVEEKALMDCIRLKRLVLHDQVQFHPSALLGCTELEFVKINPYDTSGVRGEDWYAAAKAALPENVRHLLFSYHCFARIRDIQDRLVHELINNRFMEPKAISPQKAKRIKATVLSVELPDDVEGIAAYEFELKSALTQLGQKYQAIGALKSFDTTLKHRVKKYQEKMSRPRPQGLQPLISILSSPSDIIKKTRTLVKKAISWLEASKPVVFSAAEARCLLHGETGKILGNANITALPTVQSLSIEKGLGVHLEEDPLPTTRPSSP